MFQISKMSQIQRSLEAKLKFLRIVEEKGGILITGYTKTHVKVTIRCKNSHEFSETPTRIVHDDRWCTECPSKKTLDIQETLKRRIKERGGILLSEYTSSTTPVSIQCNRGHKWDAKVKTICKTTVWCHQCAEIDNISREDNVMNTIAYNNGILISQAGHDFKCNITNLLLGVWCTLCTGRSREAAEIKLREIISNRGGTLMSEYVNTKTHCIIKCAAGHLWPVIPQSIVGVMDTWCPYCNDCSLEQAKQRFYIKVLENDWTIIGPYINSHTKVEIICKNGHHHFCIPRDVVHKNRKCGKCANNCPIKAMEKFYSVIAFRGGTVLGTYVNTYTKVEIMCNNGHKFHTPPGAINYGDWCRACAGHCPIEAFKRLQEIVAKYGGLILEDYINTHTKIEFQCEKGHRWRACPMSITNSGTWCKTCRESHGEREIAVILARHNIPFNRQKQHPSLSGYYFDFKLQYNGKEFYLEFDGEQHFKTVEFFGITGDYYEYRRYLDVLKSYTVLENNGNLIRLDCTLSNEQLEAHILKAINSNNNFYLSDPDLYDWLINDINPRPMMIPSSTIQMNSFTLPQKIISNAEIPTILLDNKISINTSLLPKRMNSSILAKQLVSDENTITASNSISTKQIIQLPMVSKQSMTNESNNIISAPISSKQIIPLTLKVISLPIRANSESSMTTKIV